KDGRIRSALTVVAYALRDVRPGEGGFGCIPGSHKSNYRTPPECMDLAQPHPCMTTVRAPAGSAILFTEALAHGTAPWRGAGERRTVFYK
ncbi:phytanoyl-CoA dioxygenase family protein, partial [Escherichia coli]|nr:phytanoyl-CoA dioxygenase family protein [Escherichia coli]